MTENCGDIYGSYTWGNLTWNGAEYDEHYNVFKYTFPEFVQVNMVNPRSWAANKKEEHLWFYRDMHRAIALGSILWLGITTCLSEEGTEYHVYAPKAIAFRKSLQPMLKHARFADDAWLRCVPQFCQGTCWELQDGRRMVLLSNGTEEEQVFDVCCEGPKKYSLSVVEGAAPAVQCGESTMKLTLEPSQMCCLILG